MESGIGNKTWLGCADEDCMLALSIRQPDAELILRGITTAASRTLTQGLGYEHSARPTWSADGSGVMGYAGAGIVMLAANVSRAPSVSLPEVP